MLPARTPAHDHRSTYLMTASTVFHCGADASFETEVQHAAQRLGEA